MDGPPLSASRSSANMEHKKCSLLNEKQGKRHHGLVEGRDPNRVGAEEKAWGENSVEDLIDGDNMEVNNIVLSSAKCIDKALKPCTTLLPRAVHQVHADPLDLGVPLQPLDYLPDYAKALITAASPRVKHTFPHKLNLEGSFHPPKWRQ
ncbi:hypothetical protein TanjilG_24125 [Lupinus angustifolius]|uniref:Uncharacterized protein n=1 Tax=Lupinus angustifolius TaxID=3871 RepID=A0A1J7HQE1_LUPAN|nr:hypothetical protein TanjilG_24125 [Lupinus angustifolius]